MSAQISNSPLHFKLHLNVLHHLGTQLYASAPSVLTELVANAWDADATQVHITIDEDKGTLSVRDNGHGMSRDGVQGKFLSVGYNRREHSNTTDSGKRKPMGRKGIGKLAMFSIAHGIAVRTQAENEEPIAFDIDVDELEKHAKADKTYYPVEQEAQPFPSGRGTEIQLEKLNHQVRRSATYLIPRIARRFGIVGPGNDFCVFVNEHEVTRRDAKIFDNLQFLWTFDSETEKQIIATANPPIATLPSSGDAAALARLDDIIDVDGRQYQLRGFIGTVSVPSQLGDGDESINKISLFAHGRLWKEDLLADIGNARYFNSYVVGEIYADFLDDDGIDRATSAREAVIAHDPLFVAIGNHLKKCLAQIRDQWDQWRQELNPESLKDVQGLIKEWIDSLKDERDKQLARRLVGSVDKAQIYDDPARNAAAKNHLLRSTIVGFEKLRLRKELIKLDAIDNVLSAEFQGIFATIDDVEEAYFYDISRGRLDVINAFDKKITDEVLEKVVQDYLMDHLWLLDPTWDRIHGTSQDEVRMSDYLRATQPEGDDGARLDIAYRAQSGRHVVIELKRPGVKVPFDKIMGQCSRYLRSVKEYVKQHGTWMDGGGAPASVVVYFVMSDRSYLNEDENKAIAGLGVTVLTYETLIKTAQASYQSYFEARKTIKQSRAESILARLEHNDS